MSHHAKAPPSGKALAALAFTALGVVYGDIGTSPLYAIKECFSPLRGLPVTHDNVLGVLSLVLWSMTLVISVKYIGVLLKAAGFAEVG